MQVPFLFKYAVDYLNDTPLVIADAETAAVSFATILILGCKYPMGCLGSFLFLLRSYVVSYLDHRTFLQNLSQTAGIDYHFICKEMVLA